MIAAIGSTRLTTEDAYLLQRFVRDVLGSPHVSAGIDPGVAALVAGMGEALGTPRSTATIADLATADAVLVLRGDPGRTHPLVKTELVTATRRGAKVLLAHPSARHARRPWRRSICRLRRGATRRSCSPSSPSCSAVAQAPEARSSGSTATRPGGRASSATDSPRPHR